MRCFFQAPVAGSYDFEARGQLFELLFLEDWAELPWYAKDWQIGRRLTEKATCQGSSSMVSLPGLLYPQGHAE